VSCVSLLKICQHYWCECESVWQVSVSVRSRHTVKHYYFAASYFRDFLMQKICCIIISRIFQLILSSNLFPISFGVSNKCDYWYSSRIIVYIKPIKDIAYHITEELIFHADKIMVMGSSKNSRVFNFKILLKLRKVYAREIYMFYSNFFHDQMWWAASSRVCCFSFLRCSLAFVIF